ncbi:MAG TPA: tRNA uridine-5-carboxymethylaminomethyl(34) synthesis GTPase MnmE, partial [Bacteroidia bacterium]|nr:tRNA uridine-5-carboxymethylaminomethyl(34) synthesis GTPase MnmE [Bacteroidia bacterium]
VVANKIDAENLNELQKEFSEFTPVYISAKEIKNIDTLKSKLVGLFDARTVNTTETIVTNARHTDSLKRANQALKKVADGLEKNIAGDLLAMEIRYALDELGSITGEVTNDDLLDSIFTRFCIGK